jgi:hypothetical protein
MAIISAGGQTAAIRTGNVQTSYDPWVTLSTSVGGQNVLTNGALNPVGEKYYDTGYSPVSSLGGTAVLTQPGLFGSPVAYRYVLYKSATNANFTAAPAAVWWADTAMTTVTSTASECAFGAATGAPSFPAGLMMINTTTFPGSLSGAALATLINNGGLGSFVWIVVFGLVQGVASSSTAAGDKLMATVANWSTNGGFSNVAVGVAATNRIFGYSSGASPSTVMVVVEGA